MSTRAASIYAQMPAEKVSEAVVEAVKAVEMAEETAEVGMEVAVTVAAMEEAMVVEAKAVVAMAGVTEAGVMEEEVMEVAAREEVETVAAMAEVVMAVAMVVPHSPRQHSNAPREDPRSDHSCTHGCRRREPQRDTPAQPNARTAPTPIPAQHHDRSRCDDSLEARLGCTSEPRTDDSVPRPRPMSRRACSRPCPRSSCHTHRA